MSVRLSACVLARQHQADNLAKLWQEFLSLLELIAKIFCAVEIARTSAVNGNRHCVAFLFRGFPRRFAPLNDITQAIAIALATVFSRMKSAKKPLG